MAAEQLLPVDLDDWARLMPLWVSCVHMTFFLFEEQTVGLLSTDECDNSLLLCDRIAGIWLIASQNQKAGTHPTEHATALTTKAPGAVHAGNHGKMGFYGEWGRHYGVGIMTRVSSPVVGMLAAVPEYVSARSEVSALLLKAAKKQPCLVSCRRVHDATLGMCGCSHMHMR